MKQIPKVIKQQAAHWLPVCPVHLIADRDTLLLAPTEHLALSLEEAQGLAESFNQHFAELGYQLYVHTESRWYLSLPQPLRLRFPDLSRAIGMNLRDVWQGNQDAKAWRKLLNETQMLWFTDAVNQHREAEGKLPINGLWVMSSSWSFSALMSWLRSLRNN